MKNSGLEDFRPDMLKQEPVKLPVTIDDILQAQQRLSKLPYASPTVLKRFGNLSERFGMNVFAAIMTPEKAGKSFKWRGSANAIMILSEKGGGQPVVASAGNHAQGVALVMDYLGKIDQVGEGKPLQKAIIFMPDITDKVKIDAVKKLGGDYVEICLVGKNFGETNEAANDYAKKHGGKIIHPFDDLDVIAGQGGTALEIINVLNWDGKGANPMHNFQPTFDFDKLGSIVRPDLLMTPVGGGGLLAGQAAALKYGGLNLRTKIIGVEPDYVPSLTEALKRGHPVTVQPTPAVKGDTRLPTAAGISVERVGDKTFEILKKCNVATRTATHQMLTWETVELHNKGLGTESAGSSAVAGYRNLRHTQHEAVQVFNDPDKPGTVVLCVTGANIGKETLSKMQEWVKRNPDFPADPLLAAYEPRVAARVKQNSFRSL